MDDIISFKGLFKAIMNAFVKVDYNLKILTNEDDNSSTGFINLVAFIMIQIIKCNFVKKSFYFKHQYNSEMLKYITYILQRILLGLSSWFGYDINNLETRHELLLKLYQSYISGDNNQQLENTLKQKFINFLENERYLNKKFHLEHLTQKGG